MSTTALETAISFLAENDDFLILSHMKPDGDTLGSAFALCNALRQIGKRAQTACSDEITPRYQYLSEGFARPEIYFSPKFYITVDIADTTLLGELYAPLASKINLAIDHHPSFKEFGEINVCVPSAGACGEIIYALIKQLGAEFTEPISTAIYTAIATDTGCFRYSNTTPTTLRIAAALIEGGFNAGQLNYTLFMEKSRTRFQVEAHILRDAKFYEDGKIVVGIITQDLMHSLQLKDDDLEDLSSLLRTIQGVEVAFLIKESASGYLKISCRSNALINATEIAEKFGGGGHKRASGMKMTCTIEEAIEKLLEQVKF